MSKYDFIGCVTKNDIRCSDGVTIRQGAFAKNHGTTVPLVWQHNYNDVHNVLGHMELESGPDGVYGKGFFNDTDAGQHAKEMVLHGDVTGLSIGARGIQKDAAQNVLHGEIYEVSLVLKGANPGATIEHVVMHSAYGVHESEDDIVFYNGYEQDLLHGDTEEENKEDSMSNETIGSILEGFTEAEDQAVMVLLTEGEDALTQEQIDLLNNFSEEQIEAVHAVAEAMSDDADEDYEEADDADEDYEEADDADEDYEEADDADATDAETTHSIFEGEETLKHNAFYGEQQNQNDKELANTILHAAIDGNAPSLAATLQANGFDEITLQHGLVNIDTLFPQPVNQKGIQVYNPQGLNIEKTLGMFFKSPMSRIKNMFADISEDEARARGYIKGNEKLEAIESLYFRETTPGTIMRKTRIDRDDLIDIKENGIDVVAFLQKVQQAKLQEEIVRAAFIGDGRKITNTDGTRNPDKISEEHIRPIVKDADLFTIKAEAANFGELLNAVVRAYPAYQGSGAPTLFINPFDLAELQLLTDKSGRPLYGSAIDGKAVSTPASVAANLRCSDVVELRFLPRGTIVIGNLNDYAFGRSKGGEVATFDQFDMDLNQQKYLIETRLSGAIQTPKSFIVVEVKDTDPEAVSLAFDPTGLKQHPAFTENTDTVEVPGAKYASKQRITKETAQDKLDTIKAEERS